MTAKEILNKIEELGISKSEFAYNEISVDGWDECGIGEMKEVKQHGGEGQGDTWYSVKYFPKHDVHIRIDGFYTSYHGTDFHSGYGYEVKPQQKTVTTFE